jgi:hypothetical protein
MSELTSGPLSDEDFSAINNALASLPEELGERVKEGIMCAAALGESMTMINEGDSYTPNSFWGRDRGAAKERFKDSVYARVASSLGIEDPSSEEARSEVTSRLTWTGFLATGLRYSALWQR